MFPRFTPSEVLIKSGRSAWFTIRASFRIHSLVFLHVLNADFTTIKNLPFHFSRPGSRNPQGGTGLVMPINLLVQIRESKEQTHGEQNYDQKP